MYVYRLAENLNNSKLLTETSINEVAGHTTAFQDDGVMHQNDARNTQLHSMAVNKYDDNSIPMFLSKPHIIASGEITGVSPGSSFFFRSIAQELMSNPLWRDKLKGYRYLRGTAVLRLVINSQPFQAGRLIMHVLPCQIQKSLVDPTYLSHNDSLTQITCHPSVEIDMRDTAVELKIPYVTPSLWFDTLEYVRNPSLPTWFDWGTVYLTVLSSLRSNSVTNVGYSLYLSFEDVELAAPIKPESSVRDGKKIVSVERKNLARPNGKISSTLEALRTPAQIFSKVPIIGGAAAMADTVLDGLSSVASIFGFSKPIDMTPPTVVIQNSGRTMGNFNGSFAGDVLALDAGNQLPALTNFAGTEKDEMSFSYLKRIPAWITSFTWDTSQLEGSQIFELNMNPVGLNSRRNYTVNSQNYATVYYPPFAHIARLFEYYRGGVEITMKFIKTQYHSGRVVISYSPGTGTLNINDTDYVYREIVDLRESSEVTLRIPYMFSTPFVPVNSVNGVLRVHVLNDLKAASTVSSEIEVLVYAAGAEDFELAVPAPPQFSVVAESGDSLPLVSKGIAGVDIPPPSFLPAESSIGEVFASIKQLFNCSRVWSATGNFRNASINGSNNPAMIFKPFFHGIRRPVPASTSPGSYNNARVVSDYFSELATGFVFERGGMRFSNPASSTAVGFAAANLVRRLDFLNYISVQAYNIYSPPIGGIYSSLALVADQYLSNTFYKNTIQGVFDFIVPHYSQTHMRMVRTYTDDTTPFVDSLDYPKLDAQIVLRAQTQDAAPVILRAAADDYAVGYFIGFLGVAAAPAV